MLVEVKVPVFPESISEGTLLNWYKESGDAVQRDESLIDLETDKAMMEITSPADGIIKEIKVENNSTVHGGEIIALIDTADTLATAKTITPKASADSEKNTGVGKAAPLPEAEIKKPVIEISQVAQNQSTTAGRRDDIQASPTRERPEQRVPMSRLRTRIAERLKQAQDTAAILTTFNEINMKSVMDLRTRYQEDFQKKYSIKLGFMSFFIKASVEALKKFPIINASVDGNDVIYHGYFDLGVAVSTERGLVVPVVRDADLMSFSRIEATILDFTEKAQDASLSLEELTGGTFTITNGGVFGSLLSTPILNPPQSAILGMHKIEERPIVENGQIVARPMMYVALSYDHRIIDGHEAVLFLKTVKDFLEDPARMLLQI